MPLNIRRVAVVLILERCLLGWDRATMEITVLIASLILSVDS